MNAKDFACLQLYHDPKHRFAYHTSTEQPACVGMWADSLNRFGLLAAKIGDRWTKFTQEIMIDTCLYPATDGWVEVIQADVDNLIRRALDQFKGN